MMHTIRRLLLGFLLLVLTTGAIVLLGITLAASETTSAQELPAAAAEAEEPTTQQTLPEVTEETKPVYTSVPVYFQTDYPYIPYGNGTIATSGCSMTCLAMVATYLTDQEYTPDGLVHHFGSYGKNNIERLDYGISEMQLPYVRSSNVQEVFQAMKEGKVAIVMMGKTSRFTDAQHFIVLAGMTEDGKILVNDPLEPNYTASVYMEQGFANGFEFHDISTGFSGGWIFDKTDIPEDYFFDGSKPVQQENRYRGYELSEKDIYLLASFAQAQDKDASEKTQQAFLEVILNRVVSGDFPNTVHDVIYQSGFYSLADQIQRAEPNMKEYRAVTAAMYGPYILPENVCYFSKWEDHGEPWDVLEGYTFYYAKSES